MCRAPARTFAVRDKFVCRFHGMFLLQLINKSFREFYSRRFVGRLGIVFVGGGGFKLKLGKGVAGDYIF